MEVDVEKPVAESSKGSARSRDRNKAQRMHLALAALDSGDDEPQPKKKRKRTATSGHKATSSKRKPSEDDRLSESDGGSFVNEDDSQDEEPDTEIEVVMDNSELAEGLASKTDPSANGVRKGKGKEKESDNAGAKPKKKRRRVANQPEKVIEPGREPSDRPNAAKAAKSPANLKANPIRHFFTVLGNKDANHGCDLLEVIGALTKEESKKAGSQTSRHAYQETVTLEDNHNADCAAAARTEEEDILESDLTGAHGISLAVFKLRKIVKYVRSSPQRRRAWELTVKISLDGLDAELSEAQLMLILDVRTRWTSTHQMLRRAIHNRNAITRYVESSSDLSGFALSDLDWEALQTVRSWLSEFRQATTEMSTTSKPMLSQTHLQCCTTSWNAMIRWNDRRLLTP